MRTRQVVFVVLAVFAASTFLFGTGAFSAASMDRGVHVSVADSPHDAFVSVWDPAANSDQSNPLHYHRESPVRGRETVTVLIVENRLNRPISISIANGASSAIEVSGSPTYVSSYNPIRLNATVDCGGRHGLQKTVPLVLSVESIHGGLSARINTSTTIQCGSGSSTQTPDGTGNNGLTPQSSASGGDGS